MIIGIKCNYCNEVLKIADSNGEMIYCECKKSWIDTCKGNGLYRYPGYLCSREIDENYNIVVDEYVMNKRAKTDEQKRKILDQLYNLWIKVPELRLGQLISNYLKDPEIFYVEDQDFILFLEAKYDKSRHDTNLS